MKKLLLSSLLGLILLSGNLFAQTQSVVYQGIAINDAGQRWADQTIGLKLSIISQSPNGASVYVETQTTTTNGTGAYTIHVGQGNAVSGSFNSINWMAYSHFLKVEMDPAGGANYAFVSLGQVAASAMVAGAWQCGNSLTVNHIAGSVAPVNKTTSYGTVTNIPGETSKCWITSNLGSDHQATTVNDASEASAGWYWQFNHKQGFKHDGTTLTPAWMTSSIIENSDWLSMNDPCTSELGTGWRIPSSTEWSNVQSAGNWTNWNGPWNSGLKLHAAGDLTYITSGSLVNRGSYGHLWSSVQNSVQGGLYYGSELRFTSIVCFTANNPKAFAFSIRCIKD